MVEGVSQSAGVWLRVVVGERVETLRVEEGEGEGVRVGLRVEVGDRVEVTEVEGLALLLGEGVPVVHPEAVEERVLAEVPLEKAEAEEDREA